LGRKVLSVHKEEGLAEFLKERGVTHRQEETGSRSLEDMGVRTLEGFIRARRNLREFAKSGVNSSRWIWKGHMEYIHKF
jgi:hypothetical protein